MVTKTRVTPNSINKYTICIFFKTKIMSGPIITTSFSKICKYTIINKIFYSVHCIICIFYTIT